MSTFRLGNLSPTQFAERVGTEFTEPELEQLKSVWSQQAKLTGPEDFHIFDAPTISVTIGSVTAGIAEIFKAAHERQPFNRSVSFDLDNEWEQSK